jgi:hypothetical protein
VDLNLLSSQRSIAIILRKQRIAQAPYFQSVHRAQRKRENPAFHEGIQQKPFWDATRDANVGWQSTFTIKLNFKKASAYLL